MTKINFVLCSLSLLSIFLVNLSTAWPVCSEKRDGRKNGRQRTLYVPTYLVEEMDKDDAERLIEGLCCVYTKVEVKNRRYPSLKLYDKSTYSYRNYSNFGKLVDEVKKDM